MPTPFPSCQLAPSNWPTGAKPKPTILNPEWRCTRCDKLLGVCRDGRMHLRFAPVSYTHLTLPTSDLV